MAETSLLVQQMKKLLLILLALVTAAPIYAETFAKDGGVTPRDGEMVGGVDSNTKFQFMAVGTDGKVLVSTYPSGTPMPVSGTLTPSGSPVPITATTPIPITATTPIPTTPKQLTGTPSSFALLTADGTVFTLAAGEIGFIQNLSSDAPLAVKYGASASTTSLNFILAAGTAASDGKGGAVRIDDWVGVVSVAKMTGTASYLAFKRAP